MIYTIMKKAALTGFPLLIALSATKMAQAEVRKYSYNTLNILWNNTVLTSSIKNGFYQKTLTNEDKKVVSSESSQQTNRRQGRHGSRGQQKSTNSSNIPDNERFFFKIIPVSSEDSAILAKREIALAIFASKAKYYEGPSLEVPSEIVDRNNDREIKEWLEQTLPAIKKSRNNQSNHVSRMQYSTHLELYYLSLIGYQSAETIASKCSYLKKAREYERLTSSYKAIIDESLITGKDLLTPYFTELNNIYDNVNTIFSKEINDNLVCVSSDLNSRKQDIATAKTMLNELIIQDLNSDKGEVQETLKSINTAQNTFSTILDKLKEANPHNDKVLELERDLINARSNFEMVKDDDLGAKAAIMQLNRTVKLDQIVKLNETGMPHPIPLVEERISTLVSSIKNFLNAINKLSSIPEIKDTELSTECSNIVTNIDSKQPTVNEAKLKACLIKATQILAVINTPDANSQQAKNKAFAKELEEISAAVIELRSY